MRSELVFTLHALALSAVKDRVQVLFQHAQQYYNMPFPPPTVLMDITGSDAGQSLPEQNVLRFNPMFYRDAPEHYLEYTVAHEVAHLISFHVFGRRIRPHGKEWGEVMCNVFKVPATRCHTYDLRVTGRYPFIYRCNCLDRETAFSRIRHSRANQGTVYLCQYCKNPLIFSHTVRKVAGRTLKAVADICTRKKSVLCKRV